MVGCWNFLVSFVVAPLHVGHITMFLKTSNKISAILCSTTFNLHVNGKVLYFNKS